MQALFEAVRQACTPHVWSRGVEFTRANAVLSDRADDEEVVFKVVAQDRAVQPTVTLWPDDEDWSCDCDHPEAVCPHVAAAVIAFRQAGQAGKPLPAAQQANGKMRYAFSRSQGALNFERYVVHDGREQLLESPLSLSLTRPGGFLFQGRVSIAVAATPDDLGVESALGAHRRGRLPRETMRKLLAALARCPDVRLDGRTVKTLPQPIGLRACLEDQDDGFRLFLEPDPAIERGVRQRRDASAATPCGPPPTPASPLANRLDYSEGRHFSSDQLSELFSDILPSLEKRLPVRVRTRRLPQVVQEPPRILLDVHREGDALTVLPTLVYGRPPLARVDADRLVHLQGALPKRNEGAEQRLVRQLRQTMRLAPGHKAQYTGTAAVRVAARLKSWRGEIRGDGHTAFELAPPLVPQGRLDFDELRDVV